ncbi:ABC transporter substrate-binding protein [Cohnella nanjingensis]|uniref:Sugar ABC transporter substrate-binding protein n=1 Tax=Cohnella nanjingensis TaxID=1387779 RepID=A0A7X0RQB7_9BACL|nr:sugar ABC transporter substrate-binding protein [Cohnella nanjingensis]MBB6670470.1 sugar ABC transporter substrate-binding protein [Cohnella nanjingensis]
MQKTKTNAAKVLIPLTVLGMVLSACGGNSNANSSTSPSPSASGSDAPAGSPSASASASASGAPEAAGKVTYMMWGTEEEVNQTKDLLKKFNEKYPNVEVDVVSKDWGTYWTAITAQAASKSLPDVYKMSYAYVDKYAKLGAMKDLTDLIASSGFNLSDFEPGVLAAHQSGGKQVSLPRDSNTIVLYYNKKLFEDAKTNPLGAPVPTNDMTWDQLIDIAKKMTLDKGGKTAGDADFKPAQTSQWGFVMDAAGSADSVLEPELWSNGAKMVNDDESLALNSPEAIEVLNKFAGLVATDHVTPSFSQSQSLSKDPFLALATGKVAMSFGGSWSANEYKKAGIAFDTVLPPKFKETKTVVQVAGNAMSPNSKNEAAAWALLSWLAGPDGQIALAEQGQSIPANKQAAATYLGIDDGYNKQTFIEAQKYAITAPFFDGKDKLMWEIVPQKLQQPLSGKGDIAKAIEEIQKLYGK